MKKIQTKITLTYAVLALVVVIALGSISSIRIEAFFKDRMITQLSTLVNVVALLIRQESVPDLRQIDERVKSLAGVEGVRISVISPDGTVLTDSEVAYDRINTVQNHYDRPEVREAVSKGMGIDTRRSDTVHRDFMYVARRVNLDSASTVLSNIYIIRVAAPLDEMKHNINEIRYIIFLAGVVVLFMVVAVSFFVSRRITKPLADLARSVEEIREGNLDRHIEITTEDEIAMVARTVNGLVDKVKADIERMTKLEKYRSEFLGNVSHELRTPIFSLQGFIETLLNGAVDDPNVNRDFLRKAYNHAARLNTLLNDLINISQIETGEMKMSFHSFPLREFFDAVVKEMAQVAEQNHVMLKMKAPSDDSVYVYGDKQRLLQVMCNLIQNAIKYNKPYGEVVLSYERLNEGVRISVSDSGIGIAEEHLPRIFERFYRVDRDRSREVGGTGLGLSIVKHIVEAHKSNVSVKSIPGKGSVFSFELKTGNAGNRN
jgi:two-component system, OmpR family, phosphate regulon sensor histidine kinase PhoR